MYTAGRSDTSRSYLNGADYVSVAKEQVAGPYIDERKRLFYASSQYYAAYTTGRMQMTAAIVAVDPADLEGVELITRR